MKEFDNKTLQYCYDYITGYKKLEYWECKHLSFSRELYWAMCMFVIMWLCYIYSTTDMLFSKYALIIGIAAVSVCTAYFFLVPIIMIHYLKNIYIPKMMKVHSDKLAYLDKCHLLCKLCGRQTIVDPEILKVEKVVHPELKIPLFQLTVKYQGMPLQLYTHKVDKKVEYVFFEHEFTSTI